MKRMLVMLWCVLFSVTANAQTAESSDSTKQLWQLIDYVAVDYNGAVADGAIISEAEYAEMLDFTENAQKQVQALAEHPSKANLIASVDQLREAVVNKADSAEVAKRAHAANDVLIAAYPFPVAPHKAPDLAKGATLYAQVCGTCHGVTGNGDGPAAKGLDPAPIAFTDHERAQSRSVMALYQVISQGVEGTSMVSFAALPEDDRWALAFYIGNLSNDDATRAQGEKLWATDASLKNLFPDLTAVTTITESAAAEKIPKETARVVTAYLRAHPEAVESGKPRGLDLARQRLDESLRALQSGDRNAATKLALSAYLDGFEPIEPTVSARNKSLLIAVESAMLDYRSKVTSGSEQESQAAAAHLRSLFDQVDAELGAAKADSSTTFFGALTILLREGLEALLIVIGIIAFLRKANQPTALRYVHAGWISALIAGALTWVVSTYLIAISGASREVTEGLSSLFAAIVLLSVGLWMHQKSSADRWQSYLNEKLSSAISHRSVWALFALSFIAVYREVFETVLFYSALAADGNGTALLSGFFTAVALLIVIAWILLRTSARMPIGKFFSITSIFVAVLAVILVGKGVVGLQEAGWISVHPIAGPRIDILGILPTAETVIAQLAVLLIAIAGFAINYSSARKSKKQ